MTSSSALSANLVTIPTACYNNCGGSCPLLVQVENGEITRISGNPDYPDLQVCIRCMSAKDTFLSEGRLLYPMKRIGKRGEGRFERIIWDEAIATITRKWIPLNPGTDAALMDAMAYVIYTENLYDHHFVEVYSQGFTRASRCRPS